ncbi:hypothetical protein GH714_016357 [Hevea brasiliensis]|uniref:Uncharacterized protein n=1 Tax=Hevea brasiliensis TaxID=3981 RepID=A0A6A6LQF3_HEVBR|nr:hypothetical protein GH714_016357 [Hevea brasiliensis]
MKLCGARMEVNGQFDGTVLIKEEGRNDTRERPSLVLPLCYIFNASMFAYVHRLKMMMFDEMGFCGDMDFFSAPLGEDVASPQIEPEPTVEDDYSDEGLFLLEMDKINCVSISIENRSRFENTKDAMRLIKELKFESSRPFEIPTDVASPQIEPEPTVEDDYSDEETVSFERWTK